MPWTSVQVPKRRKQQTADFYDDIDAAGIQASQAVVGQQQRAWPEVVPYTLFTAT